MRVLKKQNIEDLLFLDIETAPLVETLEEGSPLYDAWEYYCINNNKEDVVGSFSKEAALQAEFSRIVCITVGAVRGDKMILKSFNDPDEKVLLEDFNQSVEKFSNSRTALCGHAIVGFDAPFIMKRCLVNRVDLHLLFDVAHLKPWEVNYFDTALLWKGTGFRNSSLISVTTALGLPSPKDDISGRDVGRIYYEGGIDRITAYCEKDVSSVINIVRVLRGEAPIKYDPEVVVEDKKIRAMEYLFLGGKYTPEVREGLVKALSSMTDKERIKAAEILNVLPTKAKGKETFITKKDIKELFDDIGKKSKK